MPAVSAFPLTALDVVPLRRFRRERHEKTEDEDRGRFTSKNGDRPPASRFSCLSTRKRPGRVPVSVLCKAADPAALTVVTALRSEYPQPPTPAPIRLWPASGDSSIPTARPPNPGRSGPGPPSLAREWKRPDETVGCARESGGEIKSVRGTSAAAVTKRHAPELALAEDLTAVEHDLALPDSAQRVGVDRAVAVVVADEQVAAELAPARRRDGQTPGRIQMMRLPSRRSAA